MGVETYSAHRRDSTPSEPLRMAQAVHPEDLLGELLASWSASLSAGGRRLITETDDLAARVRDLRAEIATLSVDEGQAE